jgi:hypothetical protein
MASLWLPTLLSAVAVFLLSFLLHMLLPWHRRDYKAVPNEAQFMDAARPLAIPPGDYLVPCAGGPSALRSPEFVEKMTRGPVMILTVRPNGPPAMGGNLIGWFIYSLFVGGIAGHIAERVGVTNGYLLFHTVALAAFLGYAAALWQMTIWYHRSWVIALRSTVDGAIYAVVTGLIFVWWWG